MKINLDINYFPFQNVFGSEEKVFFSKIFI